MIRVLRKAVESKDARTPGYRAAVEAMATATDETHYTVPRDEYQKLWQQHSPPRPAIKPQQKMFAVGDAVEKALTSVGITKELVQKITRTKDCGCKARQRWLNQAGYKVQRQAAQLVAKAAKVAGFG